MHPWLRHSGKGTLGALRAGQPLDCLTAASPSHALALRDQDIAPFGRLSDGRCRSHPFAPLRGFQEEGYACNAVST